MQTKTPSSQENKPEERCEKCTQPVSYCVCPFVVDSLDSPLKTPFPVLILQHPQEPDKKWGTAKLTQMSLKKGILKVGLSWPNLAKASGLKISHPKNWVVLFLGSGLKWKYKEPPLPGLYLVNKKGEPLDVDAVDYPIEGLIILDGNWAQSKTLWWRNAWLLKCQRAILLPREKSQYGSLRKEPRKECVSTIEGIAEALTGSGCDDAIEHKLKAAFGKLLEARKAKAAPIVAH